MKPLRILALFAVALSIMPEDCRADLIASEQFQYGSTGGALAGKNGGTGFSSGWVDDTTPPFNPETPWQYTTEGLTFGSMSTTGGAATWSTPIGPNIGIASRAFNAPLGGTIYGGYLFRTAARETVNSGNTAAVMLGQPSDTDNTATFVMNSPQFDTEGGGTRIEGEGVNMSGGDLSLGQTYLALFKFDSINVSASAWILSVSQYEHFISGGLLETDLNAAALGGGSSQVFGRGFLDSNASLDSISHLVLFGAFTNLTVTFDEIRLSNAGLNEVAPRVQAVPEPASMAMLGMGVCGVLAFARRRNASRV